MTRRDGERLADLLDAASAISAHAERVASMMAWYSTLSVFGSSSLASQSKRSAPICRPASRTFRCSDIAAGSLTATKVAGKVRMEGEHYVVRDGMSSSSEPESCLEEEVSVDFAGMFRQPEVILFSADVERAAAFYKRLGFQETFRVPAEDVPIHVDLSLDGYRIGFAAISSAREDHGLDPVVDGQRGTVTLWTDDTKVAYQTLTAAGVRGLLPPHEWLGRLLIAWVQDPDGHPIQIVQTLSESP